MIDPDEIIPPLADRDDTLVIYMGDLRTRQAREILAACAGSLGGIIALRGALPVPPLIAVPSEPVVKYWPQPNRPYLKKKKGRK